MEWPTEKMSWADFRGKLLGPTDPAAAPAGSLREQIYSKWEDLGRLACVHFCAHKNTMLCNEFMCSAVDRTEK